MFQPANVLYDDKRNLFFLIDFDCATCIPSMAPRKKGNLKKIQGSYQFTGIDALNGDFPSPKSDLDSLGQVLIWCLLGTSQWKTPVTFLAALAAEKLKWRNSNRSVAKRQYGDLLPPWLQSFIERVEQLETVIDRPDYDELARLFAPHAAKRFSVASLPAPEVDASFVETAEKENGSSSSPRVSPRSPVVVKKKTQPKPKAEKKSVSPTRIPKKQSTAPSSPGPNLRPRRAGTKYA